DAVASGHDRALYAPGLRDPPAAHGAAPARHRPAWRREPLHRLSSPGEGAPAPRTAGPGPRADPRRGRGAAPRHEQRAPARLGARGTRAPQARSAARAADARRIPAPRHGFRGLVTMKLEHAVALVLWCHGTRHDGWIGTRGIIALLHSILVCWRCPVDCGHERLDAARSAGQVPL